MFGNLRLAYVSLFALVAALVALALAVGDEPLLTYVNFVSHRQMLLVWIVPPLLWTAWLTLLVTVRQIDRPTVTILRMFRKHRYWMLRGMLLTVLALPPAEAFSAIKQAIPHIVPFYADPALIRADRLLFFGTDPWRITHALLGPLATVVIDRLYILWFLMMMALIAWYNFTPDRKLQVRGLLSYLLTWFLLGDVMALAFSSVGPCFYELYYGDPHFRPLLDILRSYDHAYGIKEFRAMDWLYRTRDQDNFGSGISAMPSLHVAVAFLMFVSAKHASRRRWLVWLTGAYAAVIWIGSIHLGWHYAVDGLVAMIAVSLIWWGTGRYVDWVEQRSTAPALEDEPVPQSGHSVEAAPS